MAAEQRFRDVDEYMASVPEQAATALTQIRELVHELAPGATERISYQMPAFELNGHRLVYMAAFKNHIGLYGVSGVVEEFGDRLGAHVNDKGSMRFLLRDPLPLPLIAEIVRFSVKNAQALPPKTK